MTLPSRQCRDGNHKIVSTILSSIDKWRNCRHSSYTSMGPVDVRLKISDDVMHFVASCCLDVTFLGLRNKIGLMCLDTRRRPRSANLCKSTRDAKKVRSHEQHLRERGREEGVFRKKEGESPLKCAGHHVDKMSKPRCTDWPSRGQDTTGLAGATISKFSVQLLR